MAIEDAVVLAHCLAGNERLSDALSKYERKRVAHTTKIVNASLGNLGESASSKVRLPNLAARFGTARDSAASDPSAAARKRRFFRGLSRTARGVLCL